jgi:hypothetical protein
MKKYIKILLLIIVCLFLYSCHPLSFEDGYHSYFIFENESNVDIAVDTHNGSNYASNTLLVSKSSIDANKSSMVVYASSTNNCLHSLRHDNWESVVRRHKYDTLKLFVFDYTKMKSMDAAYSYPYPKLIPFDSVFLQRYDLTIRDLDFLDWTLVYPPDERMRDIKMFPAYGGE